ncbi:MAG: hypothetical protein VKJ24_20110 [Synechococcales bacterium]|nr:hypothetical protein [Synechococcales bacterium]
MPVTLPVILSVRSLGRSACLFWAVILSPIASLPLEFGQRPWGSFSFGQIKPAIAQTIHRDYDFTIPIPETGKVTIRLPMQKIPSDRPFTVCPPNTALLDFAESSRSLLMICSDEQDKTYGKYWIQRVVGRRTYIRLTAPPKPNGQHPGFKQGRETEYFLYADSARPEQHNAYLEIYDRRTGQGKGEALLYHYSSRY